ncbi:MAG: acyltransferase [Pseudomonadota bacterium]|nr:acyltransferase [Pseudomonadota bacterium]
MTADASSSHPGYRADIDGLRAIAILSVLAFHAFPEAVRGGFAGVDIFFVISGYLISGIVLGQLAAGGFRFTEFYVRRIRRLFPALLAVLAACYALGWQVLLPDEYAQLGKHIAGGAGFIANILLWQESGYFDTFTEMKPLLHLWSLGVEEQFYLVWPLLLALAWRWRMSIPAVLLAVMGISFAANVYLVGDHASTAFYWPATRFWELLSGGMLAWAARRNVAFRHSPAAACAGLSLILLAVFALNKQMEFPGWWAVLPVAGACLLIASGPSTWLHCRVMAHPAMVWTGLISYPLYLWHWPLLAYLRILHSNSPPTRYRLMALVLSVALAWLTYRFVERPLRFGGQARRKAAWLLAAMAVVCIAGVETWSHDGFASRLPEPMRQFASTSFDPEQDWRLHRCYLYADENKFAAGSACIDAGQPMVFLWGDSHAAALYPGLKALQQERHFGLAQFTAAGCPPLLGTESPGFRFCPSLNDASFALIQTLHPDIVLLQGMWNDDADTLAHLQFTLGELKRIGIRRIVLMGPLPRWKLQLPRMARAYWASRQLPPQRLRFGLADRVPQQDKALRAAAARAGVEYISAYDALCDAEGCLTRGDGGDTHALMFDADHLSPQGSQLLVRRVAGELLVPQ